MKYEGKNGEERTVLGTAAMLLCLYVTGMTIRGSIWVAHFEPVWAMGHLCLGMARVAG